MSQDANGNMATLSLERAATQWQSEAVELEGSKAGRAESELNAPQRHSRPIAKFNELLAAPIEP